MTDFCDICRSPDSMRPFLEVALVGLGSRWIHVCGACGFRQVRPRLTRSDVGRLYGSDYFDPDSGRGFDGYAKQLQRYERDAYFLARRLARTAPTGRLLEVGCALGFLLRALSARSVWELEGVEISPAAVRYAEQKFALKVHAGTLLDAGFPDGAFDYVIQKDLLEHVVAPRTHLEETCRVMRPGAQLWLVTPNGEANIRPMLRAASRAGSEALPVLGQGHLSFFSKAQLIRLLEETGFRVVGFRNIGVRRGLRALGYLPERRRDRASATIARERLSGSGEESSAPAPADLIERIDRATRVSHRSLRGWVPYFYYRRLTKRLGALPAPCTIGQDFEVLADRVS